MLTRPLGRTGMTVGEIGLGTWSLSGEAYGPVTEVEVADTLRAALDAGVNFIETADCYRFGALERIIGEVLRERGREGVVVSTRIGVERTETAVQKRFEGSYLVKASEAALKRLGGEHLDVVVLHNPTVDTLARGEAWAAMESLKQKGMVRALGVSVSSREQAEAALRLNAEVLVLPYNLMFSSLLHSLSGELSSRGVGVVVRSPLAYGLLADTWHAGRRFTDDDHRAWRWGAHDLGVRLKQREGLRALVGGDVKTLREAALRYVLSNGLVSVACPGARTPEMARANANAVEPLPYLADKVLSAIGELRRDAGLDD